MPQRQLATCWHWSPVCAYTTFVGAYPDLKPERYGRYVLLDRINVGGMAEVFRGRMAGVEGFERMVALKRILPNISGDPDFVEMFVDEAKLAVQLQHANIAQMYELGKVHDTYFMAMEYVSGVDLRSMWDRARSRNRLLPIAMSCHIMQKVCEGLDAAHRKKDQQGQAIGLVHRDVSPQNILVSYEGEVKVIDFGIAKAANKVSKTQAGVLKGKFGYMSPEQVRGIDLDNRSDIFACGVVLYELLVGDRLFLGESDFSTLEKVRNVEMVPPTRLNKSLSPHLERIVMKALAKQREDRYRWASEMAEDLQRYLFATNQPFARTDLQRYMQQHFRQELGKERERLERYKTIQVPEFAEESTSRERPQQPVSQDGLGVLPPPPGPAPVPTALQPQPLNLSDVTAPPPNQAQPAQQQLQVPPPPVQAPAKGGLPSWAAGLIGALVTLLLLAVAGLLYVTQSKVSPGALTLQVVPADAKIYVNEKLVANRSPFTLENLEPNNYVIAVRKKGFKESIRAVVVAEGENRMLTMELQPEKQAPSGSVAVKTTPPGLLIYVDGKSSGKNTPATIAGLTTGAHAFALKRADGSLVHRFRMDLAEGATETVEVDANKLPPLLDVISAPEGAEVKVNGQLKGDTPVTVAGLRPGRARVEVRKEGCEVYKSRVKLAAATVETLNVQLKCKAEVVEGFGKLNITATKVCDVLLDGQKIGRTPAIGLKVAAGNHQLQLLPLDKNTAPWKTELKLQPKETKELSHTF